MTHVPHTAARPSSTTLPNPRFEKDTHFYNAKHQLLVDLGLEAHKLRSTLIDSVIEIVEAHIDRVDLVAGRRVRRGMDHGPVAARPPARRRSRLRSGDGGVAPVALPEVDVSLTIPAHNEAENIGRVLQDVMQVLGRRAAAPTRSCSSTTPATTTPSGRGARGDGGRDVANLTVVTHKQQRGYAITVCDGLRASRGKVLAFMDGDGQFDPDATSVA